METNTTTNTKTETYKSLTIITENHPERGEPFSHNYIVPELKSLWGQSWFGRGKDLAKRAITRALHGTLKNYYITYKSHTIFWEPAAEVFHIYSPKGTHYGQQKTFEAAKVAIDRQQKITEKNQNNPKN